MNKILKVALSTKFENIEEIMEILNATPNATIGAEILLGVYEAPVIPLVPTNLKNFNSSSVNIEFVSYDKFNETVNYSYNRMECVTGWILKDAEPIIENIVSKSHWSDEAAKQCGIDKEEFVKLYKKIEILTNLILDNDNQPKIYYDHISVSKWM